MQSYKVSFTTRIYSEREVTVQAENAAEARAVATDAVIAASAMMVIENGRTEYWYWDADEAYRHITAVEVL